MRFLMRITIPIDTGNEALRDPKFGARLQEYLTDIRAEAAYFTTVDGQRGGYIVVNVDDASKIPSIAEPLFLWLEADVEFVPVMVPADLAKAGTDIEQAVKKWG